MSLLEKIIAVDAPVSLKASVFEEVKPSSKASVSLTDVEDELLLLELSVNELETRLAPFLKDGLTVDEFKSNEGEDVISRCEDMRLFVMRQRHRLNQIVGRFDL